MSSTYNVNDYKVGIICALPKERTAVEAMLDEKHELQLEIPGDNNVYTFGSFVKPGMIKHNVVIASLGAGTYGAVSAAQVAGDIRRSFPHLKYGLMVGIAGAMARPESKEADIRLGDVVVGCANGVPSIIDYTRGKESAGGFDIRSELANPPEALARAVSALQTQHQTQGPTYLIHLANMLRKHKRLNESRWQNDYYNIPEAADILFESEPDKCEGTGDCGACLLKGRIEVTRKPRDLPPPPDTLTSEKFVRHGINGFVDYPLIFCGSIGSAHVLMKSSTGRDRFFQVVEEQRKAKLLCFEMEASGIVKDWPCLVIRGICDYADSHKNDAWQNFAASTAAAYTKDLLLRIPSAVVDRANPINEVVQNAGQMPSAGPWRSDPETFRRSNRTDHQTVSHGRPSNSEIVLPPLSAGEQLDLNKQLIDAAGAGDLDRVRSLHGRGADVNSSDGPPRTPTAIARATGGYKINIDTIERFPTARMPSIYVELKKYSEVIKYLYTHGLDFERQQPATQTLIRRALQEDRY